MHIKRVSTVTSKTPHIPCRAGCSVITVECAYDTGTYTGFVRGNAFLNDKQNTVAECPAHTGFRVKRADKDKSERFENIRLFDKSVIKSAYMKQTTEAQAKGTSNCPLCAAAGGTNKTRLYKENEMDADHATAWSKGGARDSSNCVMLCKTHNRSKGNR